MPNERKDYYETGCTSNEEYEREYGGLLDRAVPASDAAEGVRKRARELIERWKNRNMYLQWSRFLDDVVAFASERERVAVEAERVANCRVVCVSCVERAALLRDGKWVHRYESKVTGSKGHIPCLASPIRARKPSETRVTCPDGITHRERRVGERRVENSPPFNACLRDGRPTSGERDFSKNRRQSEERADRCQHCGGALCGR